MELPYYYSILQSIFKSPYIYIDEFNNSNVKDNFKNIFAYLTLINVLECKFYFFACMNLFKNMVNIQEIMCFIYSISLNTISALYSFEILKSINHNDMFTSHYIKTANYYFLFLYSFQIMNMILLYMFLLVYPITMVNVFIYTINVIVYSMFYLNLPNIINIRNIKHIDLNRKLSEKTSTCCICLEEINENTSCHVLKCCNNQLHESCFISYYFYNKELICPLCRYKNQNES